MSSRTSSALTVALLVTPLIFAACAKRPVITGASAPAPVGAVVAQPAAPSPSARVVPREFVEVAELRDVYFDFDRSDIRPGDAKTLDASAGWLKVNAEHLVLIEGHCDERGTNEYNLSLGERRARAA